MKSVFCINKETDQCHFDNNKNDLWRYSKEIIQQNIFLPAHQYKPDRQSN